MVPVLVAALQLALTLRAALVSARAGVVPSLVLATLRAALLVSQHLATVRALLAARTNDLVETARFPLLGPLGLAVSCGALLFVTRRLRLSYGGSRGEVEGQRVQLAWSRVAIVDVLMFVAMSLAALLHRT